MKKYVDLVLKSMVAHDHTMLPLTDIYAATENSHPASLNMMCFWRTITGLNYVGQYVCDKIASQIFFTANMHEGGMESMVYGRLKIKNELISELELYINRSRADSGFLYLVDEMDKLPRGWTSPIPANGKATRAELEELGRAIFDASVPAPEASEDCILMEVGGIVYEDPEYLETLSTGTSKNVASTEKVTIPAGLWPGRPQDPDARVCVIDEDQGIVVSFAVVDGFVSPYLIPDATESCFVPACMIEMHHKTIKRGAYKGRKVMTEMPASVVAIEMVRMHSGKVQGMHRYMNLQGPGGRTPWVTRK